MKRYRKKRKQMQTDSNIPMDNNLQTEHAEGNSTGQVIAETDGEAPYLEENTSNKVIRAQTTGLQNEGTKCKPTCKTRCGNEEGQEVKNKLKRTHALKRKMDQGTNNCDTDVAKDSTDICKDHSPTVCDGCGTNDNVIHYCLNCPGNLCDTCKTSHTNLNIHKTHHVLQRSDHYVARSPSSTQAKCKEHLLEICMFCKQCKSPCCLECIGGIHSAHELALIEDAYQQATHDLALYLEKIEKAFLPVPGKLKTVIQDCKVDMQNRKRKAEKYATTTIQKIQSELGKIEQYMKERIKSVFEKEEQDLLKIEGDICQNEIKLNDIVDEYRKVLVESSVQNVLTANENKPALQSIHLPELVLSTYNLKEGSWNIEIKQLSFGTFQESKKYLYNPTSECSTSLNFDHCLIDPVVTATLPFDRNEDEQYRPKIAATINNHIWLKTKTEVTLYEMCVNELKKKVHVSLKPSSLENIAPTEDDGIFATDSDGMFIIRISRTGDVTKCHYTAPYTPNAIHVNEEQQIIIGEYLSDRLDNCKLVVFSHDFKEVVQEIEKEPSGRPLFRGKINKVVQNGNGDYVVLQNVWAIVCVSSCNVWRWEYKDDVLIDLACDKHNNVIVCGGNELKVSILNSDGQLIRHIDEFWIPFALSIDPMGELLVLHKDNFLDNDNEDVESDFISKLKYLE